MASDTLTARLINLHDTESKWNLCKSFIPRKGELIIYDPDAYNPYPRFKLGDGKTSVVELPFAAESTVLSLFGVKFGNIGYVDGGRISSYDEGIR